MSRMSRDHRRSRSEGPVHSRTSGITPAPAPAAPASYQSGMGHNYLYQPKLTHVLDTCQSSKFQQKL